MANLGLRGKIAVLAAQGAAWASRVTGKGSGGMIGGRIASKIDPHIAHNLASGMKVALVTGTNGKSTTTKMLNAALRVIPATGNQIAHSTTNAMSHTPLSLASSHSVAWNNRGDNMTDGVTSALIAAPQARYASLEVDEMHLGEVANHTNPAAFILLNLSRDQLDRVGEIAKVERHIRTTIMKYPHAVIIANCDDPLVASAAWDCPHVVWVSAGVSWRKDATSFPRTGTRVSFDPDGNWWVDDVYHRPTPDWQFDNHSNNLITPHGVFPLHLALPGQANRGNAAQAIACAAELGIPCDAALAAVEGVQEVSGRYARYTLDNKHIRVLLAKNPAGWQEALNTINASASTVIFAVNGQIADSRDLSWIWDVDFEDSLHLHTDCRIIACGERGEDLAVRLRYAGIKAELAPYPWDAIDMADSGQVEVLANYTSFRDLKTHLAERGLHAVNGGSHE